MSKKKPSVSPIPLDELWEELLRIAVAGTERATLSPESKEHLLELGLDETLDPEEFILQAATLINRMRRAGIIPATWPEKIETLPYQTTTRETPAFLSPFLAEVLENDDPALTGLVLAELARQKTPLPGEWIPELLDQSLEDYALWPLLRQLETDTCLWLIDQNPRWAPLGDYLNPENWKYGREEVRLDIWREERAHDPKRATELVLNTWKKDNNRIKKQILSELIRQPHNAEIPLLETALDERSKEIQQLALQGLLQITASDAHKTVRDFLANCFPSAENIHAPDLPTLDKFPFAFFFPKGKPKHPRYRYLQNYLSWLPLSAWPEPLRNYMDEHPFPGGEDDMRYLQKAYLHTILYRGDTETLHDLLENGLLAHTELFEADWKMLTQRADREVLSEAILDEVFERHGTWEYDDMLVYLEKARFNWSAALTDEIMEGLMATATNEDPPTEIWQFEDLLPVLAFSVYVPLPDELLTTFDWVADMVPSWQNTLYKTRKVIKIRQQLYLLLETDKHE